MKQTLNLACGLLMVLIAMPAQASRINEKKLYGSWCFYKQEYKGDSVDEAINISFREDGSYKWRDRGFKQTGRWRVTEDYLIMSGVGRHKLISISSQRVTMERITTMKMRKGQC